MCCPLKLYYIRKLDDTRHVVAGMFCNIFIEKWLRVNVYVVAGIFCLHVVVDLSPYMLNDEVANLHVKRNRLVVASCLDIEDVIMCDNN